jgi:sugar (pentulose or hexulose) kinase
MAARGRYIVGVDNGSQSTKVVIYDLEGNAVAEGRQPLRASNRPRPGVVEHPDDDLWDSIVVASRQALASAAARPS